MYSLKNSILCFIITLINVFTCNLAVSQDLDIGINSNYSQHRQNAPNKGVVVNFAGGLIGSTATSWSYQVTPPGGVQPPLTTIAFSRPQTIPENGLELTFNGTAVEISSLSTITSGKYNVHIEVETDDNTDGIIDLFLTYREPFDLVLVLDRSGSMECPDALTTDWDACLSNPFVNSKWEILKNSVNGLIGRFQMNPLNIIDEDRLSIVYFAGGSDIVGGTHLANLNPLNSNLANVNGDILSVQNTAIPFLARSGTSYGGGLREAINRLGNIDMDRRQTIMLFTDGEEVSSPRVNSDREIFDSDGTILDDLNDYENSNDTIQIFTISSKSLPNGAATGVLAQIATNSTTSSGFYNIFSNSSGMPLAGQLSELAYNRFFAPYGSPHLINFKTQALLNENKFTFPVNSRLGKMFIDAYFEKPYADNYDFFISQNGKDIPLRNLKSNRGNYYASFFINFSDFRDIKSEGDWTIIAKKNNKEIQKASSIRFSATADDTYIKFEARSENSRVKVGEKMPLSVKLMNGSKPIEDAQVTATVIKGGKDLGDIIARANIPSEAVNEENIDAGGCLTQKYTYLLKNQPELLAEHLQQRSKRLDLRHEGNGYYRAIFDEVDVAGVYTIIYSAKSASGSTGVILRGDEQTVNVFVPKVTSNTTNKKKDKYTVSENNSLDQVIVRASGNSSTIVSPYEQIDATNVRTFNTTIRPYYKYNGEKRFIGPGYGYALSVEGSAASGIQDNCNGSYTITAIPNRKDVKVKLFDEEVTKFSALDFFPIGTKVHVGRTFPLDGLDGTFDSDFYFEAGLEYAVSPKFKIEALYGQYNFAKDYKIDGSTLYAKLRVLQKAGFAAYIAPGVGYYKPQNEDMNLGYSGRIAIEQAVGYNFRIGLEGSYFKLLEDPEYSFAGVGLSLKYHF